MYVIGHLRYMYVCMCVCNWPSKVYVCMIVCIYLCMYVWMNDRMYCMHVWMIVCMYINWQCKMHTYNTYTYWFHSLTHWCPSSLILCPGPSYFGARACDHSTPRSEIQTNLATTLRCIFPPWTKSVCVSLFAYLPKADECILCSWCASKTVLEFVCFFC